MLFISRQSLAIRHRHVVFLFLVSSALMLCGDVESNPGPGIEDVLQELKSFRADITQQLVSLRSEMHVIKTDSSSLKK